jgi:ketosteroid isomerase-like protein
MTRDELAEKTRRFTDAFHRDDLQALMGWFAEDAIYDEYQGRRSVGRAAIRSVLEPQLRGDFGAIRFVPEDLFVDEAARKTLIRWECHVEGRGVWRGLDVLHFDEEGRITHKLTYAKARAVALDPPAKKH